MDENGSVTNTTTTPSSITILDQGRTESDAVHYRLRSDQQQPSKSITCLSCKQTFESKSLSQIYEHYSEQQHTQWRGNCLYCQGKVHEYRYEQNRSVEIYHNCLRWRRGEDK